MSKKYENWRIRSGGDIGQFCGFFRRPSGGVLRSFPLRVYLLLPAVSWPLFINQGRDNLVMLIRTIIFRPPSAAISFLLHPSPSLPLPISPRPHAISYRVSRLLKSQNPKNFRLRRAGGRRGWRLRSILLTFENRPNWRIRSVAN